MTTNGRTITKESGIALGVAIALAGGLYWYGRSDATWKTNVSRDIGEIKAAIELNAPTRWSREQQRLWVEQLRRRNPSLDVPDVPQP